MQAVSIIVLAVVTAVIAVLAVQVLWLFFANKRAKESSKPFELLQEDSDVFELPDEILENYNQDSSSREFKALNRKFPINKRITTLYQPIESLELDDTYDDDALKLLVIVRQLAFLQELGILKDDEFETLKVRIFERIYRNY